MPLTHIYDHNRILGSLIICQWQTCHYQRATGHHQLATRHHQLATHRQMATRPCRRALRYELMPQAFALSLSLAQVEVHIHTQCHNNRHLLFRSNEMRRLWNPLDLPPPTIITQTGNKLTGLSLCMIHPLHHLQCAWKRGLPLRHQREGQSITHQPTQSQVIHLLKRGEASRLVDHPRPWAKYMRNRVLQILYRPSLPEAIKREATWSITWLRLGRWIRRWIHMEPMQTWASLLSPDTDGKWVRIRIVVTWIGSSTDRIRRTSASGTLLNSFFWGNLKFFFTMRHLAYAGTRLPPYHCGFLTIWQWYDYEGFPHLSRYFDICTYTPCPGDPPHAPTPTELTNLNPLYLRTPNTYLSFILSKMYFL